MEVYREIICRGFCSYYKPGREGDSCAAFELLSESLTPQELRRLSEGKLRVFIPESLICEHCSFKIDGCDFYAGLSETPCGGYRILRLP